MWIILKTNMLWRIFPIFIHSSHILYIVIKMSSAEQSLRTENAKSPEYVRNYIRLSLRTYIYVLNMAHLHMILGGRIAQLSRIWVVDENRLWHFGPSGAKVRGELPFIAEFTLSRFEWKTLRFKIAIAVNSINMVNISCYEYFVRRKIHTNFIISE